MTPGDGHFLKMIQHLRTHEEVMLYGKILKVSSEESASVTKYLESQYTLECLEYPAGAPVFNAEAATWAARVVYVSAQLILFRETKEADLDALLSDYPGITDTSAILSADLCLRFLPDMLSQLRVIDSEDVVVGLLENILVRWHYSGITFMSDVTKLDFDTITTDKYLYQMYCERILENRDLTLAQHPLFSTSISSQLGLYRSELWKEF